MKLGTWNIRSLMLKDMFSKRNWFYRLPFIIKTLKSEDPDIMCFQEVHGLIQRWSLLLFLRGYRYVFKRTDGDCNPFSMENGIAYKKSKFDYVFSFGEVFTPEADSKTNRSFVCCEFFDTDSYMLFDVVSTHFDPRSEAAKIACVHSLLKVSSMDSFYCGDFNFTPQCRGL